MGIVSSENINGSGGFNNPMTNQGDLIVGGVGGAPQNLAAGATTYVLTSNGPGQLPSWQAPGSGTPGSGTVTSVALFDLSPTPIYGTTGTPITAGGTLSFYLLNQSPNTIFAAPSGVTGIPTFRSLVAADLPIVPISLGGTGQTTAIGAINALLPSQTGFTGYFLQSNGVNALWSTTPIGTVTSVGLTDISTNAIYGVTGSPVSSSGLISFYLKNQNAALFFAGPTTGSAQPTFRAIGASDLPLFGMSLFGIVPGSPGSTNTFLRADGTWATLIPSSSGVTSVALFDGSINPIYGITNSPVTSGGTLQFYLKPQAAAQFFAGSTTGSVQPSFRSIYPSDIPTLNQNTTGSAGSVSGTNVITNSNLSQMPANTIKGNNTGALASPLDLTPAQVNAMLPVFAGSTQGLVPGSTGGTANFLRADGLWATPPSGGGGGGSVPEYTSDPVVSAGSMWVLHQATAGQPIGGLLLALTYAQDNYFLSYQTGESRIIRVAMN